MIILPKLPMPPRLNDAYQPIRGRIVSTTILRNYKRAFDVWYYEHADIVHTATRQMWNLIEAGRDTFEVKLLLGFHYSSIWTQKEIPKKMDATNRIKVVEDCVAKALEVDDCHNWHFSVFKTEVPENEPECAYMAFRPCQPMTLEVALDYLMHRDELTD